MGPSFYRSIYYCTVGSYTRLQDPTRRGSTVRNHSWNKSKLSRHCQPVSAQPVATSYRELLNLYCSRTLVTTSPGTSPTPWNTSLRYVATLRQRPVRTRAAEPGSSPHRPRAVSAPLPVSPRRSPRFLRDHTAAAAKPLFYLARDLYEKSARRHESNLAEVLCVNRDLDVPAPARSPHCRPHSRLLCRRRRCCGPRRPHRMPSASQISHHACT